MSAVVIAAPTTDLLADLIGAPLANQLLANQLAPKNAKLRLQVANKSLIAEGEVRLARARHHPFHLADEALNDGAAIFLALSRGEVDGELAAQSKSVSRLAPCGSGRLKNGDSPFARQQDAGRNSLRAGRDPTEGCKNLPSRQAAHVSLLFIRFDRPSSNQAPIFGNTMTMAAPKHSTARSARPHTPTIRSGHQRWSWSARRPPRVEYSHST
ncbi:MAG: hypothetical protein F9K29_11515 [Hyphomicrobiaceae bacterium]|nr:MAG: hypothetical protein F9K29_11515 [Hyphomicrobiaceae bacterium]